LGRTFSTALSLDPVYSVYLGEESYVWFGGFDESFVSYLTGRDKHKIKRDFVWLKIDEKPGKDQQISIEIPADAIQVYQHHM